jgi:hypothetical protein
MNEEEVAVYLWGAAAPHHAKKTKHQTPNTNHTNTPRRSIIYHLNATSIISIQPLLLLLLLLLPSRHNLCRQLSGFAQKEGQPPRPPIRFCLCVAIQRPLPIGCIVQGQPSAMQPHCCSPADFNVSAQQLACGVVCCRVCRITM